MTFGGGQIAKVRNASTVGAVFETLADGVDDLASSTLNATTRKVQVRMRNDTYQKPANSYRSFRGR